MKKRMTTMTLSPPTRRSWILLIGDWLALGLFVLLGQLDHEVLQLPRLLQTVAVFVAPWTVVALLLGAVRVEPQHSAQAFLSRTLVAWLVAAPIALLLRALLLGQATIIVAFMLVTMGLGGLFLLAWRSAYVWIDRRRRARP
jgi:hypothetical protein